jgi:acetyltransferase-like isoleucine patch superfamily enzyme
VVSRDLPAFVVAVGVPARIVRRRDVAETDPAEPGVVDG